MLYLLQFQSELTESVDHLSPARLEKCTRPETQMQNPYFLKLGYSNGRFAVGCISFNMILFCYIFVAWLWKIHRNLPKFVIVLPSDILHFCTKFWVERRRAEKSREENSDNKHKLWTSTFLQKLPTLAGAGLGSGILVGSPYKLWDWILLTQHIM